MPCDSIRRAETPQQREQRLRDAMTQLEASLAGGNVTVVIGDNGAIAFLGRSDKDRSDLTDLCGFNRLLAANSFALQTAIAQAEAIAGRAVDYNAVSAGTHSHDGGHTWHAGH